MTHLQAYWVGYVMMVTLLLIVWHSYYLTQIEQELQTDTLKKKSETFGADMNQNQCLNIPECQCMKHQMAGYQSIPPQTMTASSDLQTLAQWNVGPFQGLKQDSQHWTDSVKGDSKVKGSSRLRPEQVSAKLISELRSLQTYVNKAKKCCISLQ